MRRVAIALLAIGLLGFLVGRKGAVEAASSSKVSRVVGAGSFSALNLGVESISMVGSDFDIAQRILARVESDGAEVYARAWKDLAGLPSRRRARLESIIARWWGAADGRAAMEGIGRRWDLVPMVMQGWGSSDPEEALAYSLSPVCKRFYSMKQEIVFGLWKEDEARGVAFAREHEIRFPLKLYRMWIQRDPHAAMQHSLCDLNGSAFGTYNNVDDWWRPDDPVAELEWLMDLDSVRKEKDRNAIAAAIVREFDGVDSRAVLAALEVNVDWPGRDWMASWAIERWTKDDPEAARLWFEQISKDHEFRYQVVNEALEMGLFQDRAKIGELVAELPEKEREGAIEEVIRNRKGEPLEESLAWVNSWHDELSESVFEEALKLMIDESAYEDGASFVEGLVVLRERLPNGSAIRLIRRFGEEYPVEASAWVVASELQGRSRYYALLGTFEPWLKLDSAAAGEFMMGLSDEDRSTAARAIVEARMPAARDRALREKLGLGAEEGKEPRE